MVDELHGALHMPAAVVAVSEQHPLAAPSRVDARSPGACPASLSRPHSGFEPCSECAPRSRQFLRGELRCALGSGLSNTYRPGLMRTLSRRAGPLPGRSSMPLWWHSANRGNRRRKLSFRSVYGSHPPPCVGQARTVSRTTCASQPHAAGDAGGGALISRVFLLDQNRTDHQPGAAAHPDVSPPARCGSCGEPDEPCPLAEG